MNDQRKLHSLHAWHANCRMLFHVRHALFAKQEGEEALFAILFKLVQEMVFFDKAENTSGSLTARLGVDTASIRGAVGDQVGVLVQTLTTFIAAYAIAFSSGWKMTLVITAMLPLLIFAAYTESKFMQGFANEVGP